MGVNVAVTGLHAADNPAPGIGIARALRYGEGWDGDIIGLAYDVYDTGIYDPGLVDSVYMIPYPNQPSHSILSRILEIHSRHRIDVLIPTLDSELALYQKLQPDLEREGLRMFLPSAEAVQARAKKNLPRFCELNGIPTPKTIPVNDLANLTKALDEIGFPLWIKGHFYDAVKCSNATEALAQFDRLRKSWGLPVLVQEGIDGEEFDVCAVGDDSGKLLGAVPIRKLRLTDKGKAWSAVTLRNPGLIDLSRRTLAALKWAGPCELEILQSSRNRDLYLLEINPRFPAWIYLSAGAGLNLPRLVVDLALGNPIDKVPEPKSGVAFVRHATDLICPLDSIESLTISGELHHNKEAGE